MNGPIKVPYIFFPQATAMPAHRRKLLASRARRSIRFEPLEPRLALSAADVLSFPTVPNQTVYGGAPIWLGIDAADTDSSGGPLTYSVAVSNPDLLQAILPTGNKSLVLNTSGVDAGVTGQMTFQLFDNLAPRTTQHIEALVNNGEFATSANFYRVSWSGTDPFVIQGGPSNFSSSLGPFDDEYNPDLQFTSSDLLAMAKSSDDTNDDQIFVTAGPARFLDFNYSIFGVLTEGEAVRQAIQNSSTSGDGPPPNPITIDSAQIITDDQNAALELKAAPGASGQSDVTLTVSDLDGHQYSQTFQVTILPDPNNPAPFLNPIAPVTGVENQPINVQLTATDVQQKDADYFDASKPSDEPVNYTLNADHTTGLVTITPPPDFTGTFHVQVAVSGSQTRSTADQFDLQTLFVTVGPAGPTVDLLTQSDTGFSSIDNITNADSLDFSISGVTTGATVQLSKGPTIIASGVATGSTITLTIANPSSALGQGTSPITATETINGQESFPGVPLNVTYDTTPPTFTSTPPTTVQVGHDLNYDAQTSDETTGSGLIYSLTDNNMGALINPVTGVVTWTPTAAQTGAQSFTIVATDAAGNRASQSLSVVVGASANQPPIATDDAYNIDGDQTVMIATAFGVLANDNDPDDDTLSASLVTQPAHGTVVLSQDGSFTFTANASFTGSDSFTYAASDGQAVSEPATVHLNVFSTNQPPVAYNRAYNLAADQPQFIDAASGVLAPDSDPDGDPITASLVAGPSHGSLALSADGSFLYTPDPGFRGSDTFSYSVSDPFGHSVPALAILTVGSGSDETLVAFTLKITRPDGSPVTSLAPGDDFVLHVFTKDDHPVPHGVFAAYLDVTWAPSLAIATGPIHYSANYPSGQHTLTAGLGLIDEGGGFAGSIELGGRSLEVFSVPMRALAPGQLIFNTDPADKLPDDDVLTYAVNQAISPSNISYGSIAIAIAAAPPPSTVGATIENGGLVITGSEGRDQLIVKVGYHAISVKGTLGHTRINQTFYTRFVQHILANLGGGNDSLRIDGIPRIPVVVDAGDGNDTITINNASCILLGGGGNDRLVGGRFRDLIIGGAGRDELRGNAGQDILVGGTTAYDQNLLALISIQVEWNSPAPYATRTADLASGSGPFLAPLGVSLQQDTTVFNDDAIDTLLGGADLNWLFPSAANPLRGLLSSVLVTHG